MYMRNENRPYSYTLAFDGRFSIANYSQSPVFSSFLPGIAGVWGIPMWVFYVNRGQGIACFGTDTKDQPILEYQSASRAYQLTPTTGFRTFLKLDGGRVFEPFARPSSEGAETIHQRMDISSHGLDLCEENSKTGIRTEVSYFTVPNEPIGAFGRKVTFTNTGDRERTLEVLDGLPLIINAGLNNFLAKNMSYLSEAWSFVENVEARAPLFKIKIATDDTPEVQYIHSGNFYVSKAFGAGGLAPILVDPRLVFGEDEAFLSPERFIAGDPYEIPDQQCNRKGSPCGFAYHTASIAPGQSFTFVSFTGHVRRAEQLDAFVEGMADAAAFTAEKEAQNRRVIHTIQDDVLTVSGNRNFDFYTRQNYLDNVMRGGLPCQVGPAGKEALFYLYSRKHGDMERDYNYFKTAPTHFSQGNGNYRDVNQNRRNDVLINPFVGDAVIRTFMNLLQLDGNNPLDVQGASFFIEDIAVLDAFLARTAKNPGRRLRSLLNTGYTPGEALAAAEEENTEFVVSVEDFIIEAVALSERFESARHGEGYWTDHWTYNTDLIESYLAVYPEKEAELFFGDCSYTYFDTFCRVLPRHEKHVLTPLGVRQFGAIAEDKERHKMLEQREKNPNAIRVRHGEGEVYKTSLFPKLVVLALNKAASLDPSGVGIELDSNKPNWYDALNSLPGLFGSSTNETFELKRMLLMMKEVLLKSENRASDIALPMEAVLFLKELVSAFREEEGFAQWDARCSAKESFRMKTFTGISGEEGQVPSKDFIWFADLVLAAIEGGIQKAIDPESGLPFSYFSHQVTEWEETGEVKNGHPLVRVKAFRSRALPLFLEGVVHAMRSEADPEKVRQMHKAVLSSGLYDSKLKMFKVNASLENEGFEIGRNRAFPSGWLENESIWLHMEYKYLLELARKGLFTEYFEAAKTALVFNLDPNTYGRSILENSSFICSSAFYDESRHGRGYYARLSGSTAEFVHLWLLMVVGATPFRMDTDGSLVLTFMPAIPADHFTTRTDRVVFHLENGVEAVLDVPENAFAFRFLGRIPIVYHNPARVDTWSGHARIETIRILDREGQLLHACSGASVKGEWAERVRERDVSIGRIEVLIQG